jgi:hypothetical protein
MDGIRLSLTDRAERQFVPENTLFNPGDHDIDRIFIGFVEHGIWRIRLEKEGSSRGEIRFNQRDATLS